MIKSRRTARRQQIRMLKKSSPDYREVPEDKWPNVNINGIKRVFQNNEHLAMVYDNKLDPLGRTCTLVIMKRNDAKPITWAEMQKCKNQLFGPQALGVQYLPPQNNLVDQGNLYWFFVEGSNGCL